MLPHIVAPTLLHVRDDVFELLRDYRGPIHIETNAAHKWGAFKSMDVAVAVSGTVGLELAALQVPHVIGYRANEMTAIIARRLVRVKYAHLANIMANREIVPEFLQEKCTAENMAQAAFDLLLNPAMQKQEFSFIAERLGAGQTQTPSQKAAAFVMSFL